MPDSAEMPAPVMTRRLRASFSAAAAGVFALNESTLYTVEALIAYLDHLAGDLDAASAALTEARAVAPDGNAEAANQITRVQALLDGPAP